MIYLCLISSKAGSSFFVGDCNKNLDPLDDIYYYTQMVDMMQSLIKLQGTCL
ncbi:unnamed protein product [Brassica rapa subsp. trilocularis]